MPYFEEDLAYLVSPGFLTSFELRNCFLYFFISCLCFLYRFSLWT